MAELLDITRSDALFSPFRLLAVDFDAVFKIGSDYGSVEMESRNGSPKERQARSK